MRRLPRATSALPQGLVALALLFCASAAHGEPPKVGLIVLPEAGTDRATAREVRQGLLQALKGDRSVRLVDTARQLSRQRARLDDDARALLRGGISALDGGNPRRAVSKLRRLLTSLEGKLARIPKRALADTQLHLAAAELAARSPRRALARLVKLLIWRDHGKLSLQVSEPRGWETLMRRARALHQRLPTGSLRITSVPSRAATFVDGRRTGPTPAVISNLTIGTHYLTVRLAGYQKVVMAVRVRREEQTLAVNLRRAEEAHEMLSMLKEMRQEIGRKQVLFPAVLSRDLGLQRVLVLRVRKVGAGLSMDSHYYSLAEGKLLGSAKGKTSRPPREEQLFALAPWRAHLGDASREPQKPSPSGPPFYRRWWFWAVVGTAAAAGVVIPLIATSSTDPGRVDRYRVSW